MNMMEEHNYWRDPRTIEGMVDKGKIERTPRGNFLIIEIGDETIRLKCKWAICDTCGGDGTHVDPGIDCCGITDWGDDGGEFREAYASGAYDQTCNECGGSGKVPIVDKRNNKKEDIEAYDAYIQEEYDYAREVAAERSMGA